MVVIPPGLVFNPILNVLSSLIPRTSNLPLKPELSAPSVLLALLSLSISIVLPAFNLCGACAVIIPTLDDHVASIITLLVLRSDTDPRLELLF